MSKHKLLLKLKIFLAYVKDIQLMSIKIKANDIDFIDAECFDSFSSVIFNCKNKYCCFNKKLNNTDFFY